MFSKEFVGYLDRYNSKRNVTKSIVVSEEAPKSMFYLILKCTDKARKN